MDIKISSLIVFILRPPKTENVLSPAPQTSHLDKVLVKELQKTRKAVAEAKEIIVQASSERKQAGTH